VSVVSVLGDLSWWNGRLLHDGPHGHTRWSQVVRHVRLKHSAPHPVRGTVAIGSVAVIASVAVRPSAAAVSAAFFAALADLAASSI